MNKTNKTNKTETQYPHNHPPEKKSLKQSELENVYNKHLDYKKELEFKLEQKRKEIAEKEKEDIKS